MTGRTLTGERHELSLTDDRYPDQLRELDSAPERLYVIGNVDALQPGLAVIGARKATPYGLGCATRFARLAAEKGVAIISGGARGCDAEAHKAALDAGAPTVAFLGGGCDRVYPAEHFGLFQRIVDAGGAVVSEHEWDFHPLPFAFRARNRLIAGLAEAVLIVEAGLPSGTFSTADDALQMGKEVLVVPGAITSKTSHGSNRLLYQGAIPIVDDDSFEDVLYATLGFLRRPRGKEVEAPDESMLVQAVLAQALSAEEIYRLAEQEVGAMDATQYMMRQLADAEARGLIARMPDGRWGPNVRS